MAAPIKNGVQLVLALKASGTGEAKLAVARTALQEKGKNATAEDVITALQNAEPPVPELTIKKATSFAKFGEWLPEMLEAKEKPIEDQLAEEMGQTPPAATPPAATPPAATPPAATPPAENLTAELPKKK
jgi:hypothetical protein